VFNEDVTVDFNANVGPYTSSLGQALAMTNQFSAANDIGIAKLGNLNKISLALVQSTAMFTGANKIAVQQAAAYEQKLSGINTMAKIAGKQFDDLGKVTMKFARQFPIGMDKAIETTKALATSGVVTTKQVQKLGTEFIKLQAASGEWGSGMTQDMLQVTRSFGNSTNMIKGFSDSLVTVTTKYGASASSVLAFSKAIAPIASVVGIGQASVFGLSTAMSRLGEDGYRSANAFNKVLLDMNRSIRTGSPEIREYAKVLNMSSDSLGNLFKSDPTEMILRFTSAINKQGAQAVTTLDNLGLDGVNTFKSLQALSKTGDLRQIVGDATSAYNNGSANAGAQTALGGVNDQLTKMQETMSQTTAEAGKPFLSFLGSVLGVSNGIASGVHGLVSALAGLGPLLPVLSTLWTILKGIAVIQLGRLGLNMFKNSNFGQQFFAGRAQALNGEAFGPNALTTAGARVGQGFGTMFGGKDETGERVSRMSRLMGSTKWLSQAYVNANANLYNADPSNSRMRTDAGMARANNKLHLQNNLPLMSAAEQEAHYGKDANNVIRPATLSTMPAGGVPGGQYGWREISAANKMMYQDIKATSGSLGAFRAAAGYTAKGVAELGKATFKNAGAYLRQGSITGLDEAGGTIRGGARFGALGSMLSGMGPMLGIMATMAAVSWFRNAQKVSAERMAGTGFGDAYSVYNNFATKANLPTQNGTLSTGIDSTMDWATYYAKSAKTVRQAITLGQDVNLNALRPNYKTSADINIDGDNKNPNDLAAYVRLMAGPRANPEVISRLMQDLTAKTKDTNLTAQVGIKAFAPSQVNNSTSGLYQSAFQAAGDSMGHTDEATWRQSAYGGTIGQLIRQEATTNINNTLLKFGSGTQKMATLQQAAQVLRGAREYGVKNGGLGNNGYVVTQGMEALKIVSELLGVKYNTSNVTNALGMQRTLNNAQGNDPLKFFFQYSQGGLEGVKNNEFYKYYKTLIAKGGGDFENPVYKKGKRIVSPEEKYSKKANQDIGSGLFAAEDYAWSKSMTILDIFSNPTMFNAIKDKVVKLAINASIAQNDVSAQNAFSQAISTTALNSTKSGMAAVTELLQQLKNPNLAASSAQASAILNAYNMTASVRSVEQAGQSGLSNINQNIKTGVTAANTVLPTGATQEQQSVLGQERATGQQAVSQMMSFAKQIANLNHEMAKGAEDMAINVTRTQFKFNQSILRGTQDFAKSFYNVYERVGGQRVASTGALITNLKEQSTLLNRQMKNVTKLKKLGLSDDAIRTMDLMNPANAQQTDQLVNDMTRNVSLINQANKEVANRMDLSGQHETSPNNTAYKRAKEDFDLQMKYMSEDFEKAAKRAYNDLFNFGENISVAGSGVTNKLAKALSGMPDVAGKAAKAAGQAILDGLQTSLKGLTGNEQFSLVNGFLSAPRKAPNTPTAPGSGGSGSAGLTGGSGGGGGGGASGVMGAPGKITNRLPKNTGVSGNGTAGDYKGQMVMDKDGVYQVSNPMNNGKYQKIVKDNGKTKRGKFLDAVFSEIGQDYRLGGGHDLDDIGGFDCSGLVEFAAKHAGINAGTGTAATLYNQYTKHIMQKDAIAGDLVFYNNNRSQAGMDHVGIYIGHGMMIDAPAPYKKVRAEPVVFSGSGKPFFGRLNGLPVDDSDLVKAATGGHIKGPGSKTSDSIPARLSDGEYVIKADTVDKYGVDFFHNLNEQKFKDGGSVGNWWDNDNNPIGKNSLKKLIARAGFKGHEAMMAWAIAMAESHGYTNLLNNTDSTGDLSYGLWQINMIHNLGPERRKKYHLSSNNDLYDPFTNAKIAYDISKGGKYWADWGSYTLDHHYLDFLNYKNGNPDKAEKYKDLSSNVPIMTAGPAPKAHNWWDDWIPHFSRGGYVGNSDAVNSRMSRFATNTTNTTSHSYDHSTQIHGQITVQANDPNEFMRKINAQQRRQRLLSPVGN